MVRDLQSYYKGVVVRLDNPHGFLASEGDSLGDWFNLL